MPLSDEEMEAIRQAGDRDAAILKVEEEKNRFREEHLKRSLEELPRNVALAHHQQLFELGYFDLTDEERHRYWLDKEWQAAQDTPERLSGFVQRIRRDQIEMKLDLNDLIAETRASQKQTERFLTAILILVLIPFVYTVLRPWLFH